MQWIGVDEQGDDFVRSLNSSNKLFQKPNVIFAEEAKVVDLVFKHSYSFYSHSKSIAGILVTVDAAIFKEVRMYHAAPKYFYPAAMLANITAGSITDQAADIHLRAWFGEGKIRRPETNFNFFAKHFLHEEIECLFQVSKRNMLIYIKSFYLVKETMRPGAYRFISVYTARANDAYG
jgi:hypothetical protein